MQTNLIIRPEDIRANPELWIQKINVILFNDPQGKPYWTKEYNFLPNHERYNQAVKWIRDTEFPEYDCRIVQNENNEIEIVTRNYFGKTVELEQQEQRILRKIRKKIGQEYRNPSLELEPEQLEPYREGLTESFKFTKYEEFAEWVARDLYEEELEEWKRIIVKKGKLNETEAETVSYDLGRSDLAILWRKQLYFVTFYKYIDNWKLSVQIRAKKCPLSIYYWNWMRGAGVGFLEQGPVIEDKNQRMHFEFCGDLGIKKIYEQAFDYQPEFKLFKVDGEGGDLTWSEIKGKKTITLPSNVRLEKFTSENAQELRTKSHSLLRSMPSLISKILKPHEIAGTLMKNLLEQKIHLVIGCEEMPDISGYLGKPALFHAEFSKEDVLFTNGHEWIEKFKKQPHLWDHTTFLIYLFGEVLSINGRFIGIIAKDINGNELKESEWGKKVASWHLPYKIFISNSPGSLLYRFEFEYISVKLEVKTQGVFQGDSVFNYMTHIQVEAATFGGGISWNDKNFNPLETNAKENSAKGKENQTQKRSVESKEKDKSFSPPIFHSNTIDYNYSLGEFFNRLTNPLFFYRVETSELLHNRLGWANNKQKTLNLPARWENYGAFAQKLGEWKWKDVKLESGDYNGFFREKMEQGYILTDGSNSENPNFDYETINSYRQIPANAWDIFVAEEEKIEIEVPGEDTQITQGDPDPNNQVTKGGTFDTFLEFESQEAFNQFRANLQGPAVEQLWNTVQGTKISWGRFLTGGADGGNSEWHWNSGWAGIGSEWVANMNTGAGTTIRMKLNNTGGIDEETLRSGDYQIHIKFPSLENIQIWITGGMDKRTELKFKEAVKTTTQEIDQAELENRENEDETFEEQELNLNEIEQEKPEQGLGERSRELVQEKERENEGEQELEQEMEQEQEKEDETEKENERETEAERLEQERQEQEQEQQETEYNEHENENEEELEEL